MKFTRFVPVLSLAAVLAAAALPAAGVESLLTPKGIRFAITSDPDRPQVEIARAEGELRATLVVPSTQDPTHESQAQLAYDAATDTVYVVWVRENAGNGEIRFARLHSDGQWSTPRMVAAGSGMYRGLRSVVTQAESDGVNATLLHIAWWSINGTILDPEYGLFAFENGNGVSAVVSNLEVLSNPSGIMQLAEFEETGEPLHPPLAMARSGAGVDIAFGAVGSTAVSRLTVTPRKVAGDARMWRPVGRQGVHTPRANLASSDGDPVQAFLSKGHLALYTLGQDFSFVVLDSNGDWSPIRTVRIDEDNTTEDLLRDLQRTVEELLDQEEAGTDESLGAQSR